MQSTAKSGSDGNATFSGDVVDISSSVSQTGIFAVRGEVLLRAILTLPIYLLLNFRNLPRALSKLSSQVGVLAGFGLVFF